VGTSGGVAPVTRVTSQVCGEAMPTIVRERKLKAWEVLPAMAVAVVACFYDSPPLGVCVALACAIGVFGYMTHDGSLPPDQFPIVLEIGPVGLSIKHRWVPEVEIPWQEIEAVRLSRGRRGAIYLDIRVTEPERYLSRFMRFNLALSKYHLNVRVSGLDLSPEQIVLAVEDAQRAFLNNLLGRSGAG
jgi:hypothetical protein